MIDFKTDKGKDRTWFMKHILNGNNRDFNDKDFFPMVQFVRGNRLYYVVMKDSIEYSYMDIVVVEK